MSTILDYLGRPVQKAALLTEEATPTLTGVRQILSDHPSRGLTPQRLTAILQEAEDGDATRYLELAEDMEEKDLNYLAQLGTRKRAVAQLQLSVESASDAAEDVRAAELVREVLRADDLETVLFHALDAIGKGYSVVEILWDTSGREWMPSGFKWRPPQWFGYDRTDGTTLMLREGATLRPMAPYHYIHHTAMAKSGLPIRGGLARAAAWAWLFKNFTTKDWVAFAEVYGQPYRVGKYHPSATADDKRKLLTAVASIGSDAAAIIPESMMIEFIEAARSGSIDLYEKLCSFLDAQVTKAVLGQTLTSDVSAAGGSRALGDVHDRVRRDIMRADARQLAATLNRDLVEPLVVLNMGVRDAYPRIRVGLPHELNTKEKVEALGVLVPRGLDVETSQVRDLLGFTEPAKDAAVLRADSPTAPATPPRPQLAAAAARAAHAAETPGDAIDALARAALEDSGWQPLIEPVITAVDELLSDAATLAQFRGRLAELVGQMDTTQLRELLARNATIAHIAGGLGIE